MGKNIMRCKNDKKASYTGKEKSPKGLGYCAHAEEVGTIKKGKDGNKWVIKRASNNTLRWVKHDERPQLLYKKLFKWWKKLAAGGYVIIYKNGKSLLWKSTKKSSDAQFKEEEKFMSEASKDKEVVAIVWSGMSNDVLTHFSNYLAKKRSRDEVKQILGSRSPEKILIQNYKKYFEKYKLQTKKDYTLKQLF
jgi:hypothetical protein